jgi:transcriptional regulatory protein LevR
MNGLTIYKNEEILISYYNTPIHSNFGLYIGFNVKNILLSYKEFWNKDEYLHLINHCMFTDELKEEIVKEALTPLDPKRLMHKIEKYGIEIVLDEL